MQTITSPGVPSMSTGGLFIGRSRVAVAMFVMPPFNHYILTLHSHGVITDL
jgi:hypothetical protein